MLGAEREQALEKHWSAVQETSLTKRHHLLLQPHPPLFPASLGTSTKVFQEPVHAQPIIPCLSNAGEAGPQLHHISAPAWPWPSWS